MVMVEMDGGEEEGGRNNRDRKPKQVLINSFDWLISVTFRRPRGGNELVKKVEVGN